MQDTWHAMEELVDDGLVRSIGVCNFSTAKVADLLSYARIKPAVVQAEVHPYFRNEKLLSYCKAQVSSLNPCWLGALCGCVCCVPALYIQS